MFFTKMLPGLAGLVLAAPAQLPTQHSSPCIEITIPAWLRAEPLTGRVFVTFTPDADGRCFVAR